MGNLGLFHPYKCVFIAGDGAHLVDFKGYFLVSDPLLAVWYGPCLRLGSGMLKRMRLMSPT